MARTFKGQAVTRDETNPTDYPYDRIKNAVPGVSSGTPAQEETIGDLFQAVYEIMRLAGITPDETPEKKDSSQIADAVLGMQPVAILRVGYDYGASAMAVFGGKYANGITATFVEDASAATYTNCKLSILKDTVVSTDDYFVTITPATARESAPLQFEAKHGDNGAGYTGVYFDNDAVNIITTSSDSATVAEIRSRTQFVVHVYKV